MVIIAVTSLNQQALNFVHNSQNILASLKSAKQNSCHYRTGPELELSGYSCGDHFYEQDTFRHCWEMLWKIANHEDARGMHYDIGMPVKFKGDSYICRIVLKGNRIIAIVPKCNLRNHGFYAETRWFKPWKSSETAVVFDEVPADFVSIAPYEIKFGTTPIVLEDLKMIINFADHATENFGQTNKSFLDISIFNSCDHFCLNDSESINEKHLERLEHHSHLNPQRVFIYANMVGCDGDRVVFDNRTCVILNGEYIAKDNRLGLSDRYGLICDLSFPVANHSSFIEYPENVIRVCCIFLHDYMRRSRSNGFFIPLSGGIDSAVTASLVYYLRKLMIMELKIDVTMNDLLHTANLNTKNNSKKTCELSRLLAKQLGSTHVERSIDDVVSKVLDLCESRPTFSHDGGSKQQDQALQNVQARLRMVIAYLLNQVSSTSNKCRLMLGTGNADENIIGYFTKYDCSSADINPIGGINKTQVRDIARFMSTEIPILNDILSNPPSAELRPSEVGQNDESEMEMTFEELEQIADLRSRRCGPVEIFKKSEGDDNALHKVKRFFHLYGINRHKTAVATPCCCINQSASDDCRFDRRPLFYDWSFQFDRMSNKD